jgi:hypothetical protein
VLDDPNSGITGKINDPRRADGHEDAICCSIGFPNYKMLYSVQNRSNGSFVILRLDPAILWEKECGFYATNAASGGHCALPYNPGTVGALEHMFASEYVPKHDCEPCTRAEQSLLACDPTDPQAEVLVIGPIAPCSIRDMVVKHNRDAETLRDLNLDIRVVRNAGYFGKREDFRNKQAWNWKTKCVDKELLPGGGV